MMKLKSISFENYKAFSEIQTIQLKPITILIGKNSSGKSSIAKLFTLLENSLMGKIKEPLLLNNNGVELGSEFDNLFFENNPAGIPLNFNILFENNIKIEISLLKKNDGYGSLEVIQWKYQDDKQKYELELSNDEYQDRTNNKVYKCKFQGFIPTKFTEKNSNNNIPISKLKIDVDYIGPFRIVPERIFYLTGQMEFNDTGVTGENAYSMLGISKLKDDDLYKNVGKWYKEHFDGWMLTVDDKNRPYLEIVLHKETSRLNQFKINIVDVGQGMNQALPLVVRANVTDRPNSIIILEQPELHLHPAAHGDLAELFASSAKKNSQTFIIETHSENLLLRLRKLIIQNDFGFTKDDLIIYWVESGKIKGQELREITVNEEGVLSDWPDGVFNENLSEIISMRKILHNKKQSN